MARELIHCWIKLILFGSIIISSNVKGLVPCLFSMLVLIHFKKHFQNLYSLVSKGVHVQK